jgi:uncharacterized membrane protein YciS (DUF1049 family)
MLGRVVRTFLLLAVVGAAVVLGIQNNAALSQPFSLRFVAWESYPVPTWLVFLIVFGAGLVVGGLSLVVDYARVRRQLSRERARADEGTRRADEAARRADEAAARAAAAEGEAERLRARPVALGETIEVIPDDDTGSTALRPPTTRSGGAFE